MRIKIGLLEIVLIVSIIFAISRYFKIKKINFNSNIGITIYFLIINILILFVTISTKNELNGFWNGTFDNSIETVFLGPFVVASSIIVLILYLIFDFILLFPVMLICNLLFYNIYLKRILFDKNKAIRNLELTEKFIMLLSIIFIGLMFIKNIILLIFCAVNYIIFIFIFKKLLKLKILKIYKLN